MQQITDKEICSHIDSLKNEAKEFRAQRDGIREECEKFYAGKQWDISTNKSVKNWCFTAVETQVPIIAENVPVADVVDADASDVETAKNDDTEALSSAIEYTYQNSNIMMYLTDAIRDAIKVGAGYLYVDYDIDAENGLGAVKYSVLDWRRVYIDPLASEPQSASYVIIESKIRRDILERQFPNIDFDTVVSENLFNETNSDIAGVDYLENHWGGPNGGNVESSTQKDVLVVQECWMKDYTLEDIDAQDTAKEIAKESEELLNGVNPDIGQYEDHVEHMAAHEVQIRQIAADALQMNVVDVTDEDIETLTQDPQIGVIIKIMLDHIETHESLKNDATTGKKPKYKFNQRLILKIGCTVLYDGEPPVEDGLIPLVPIYYIKQSKSPESIGTIENIINAQRSYNEVDQAEIEGLLLCSNPGYVGDGDCGINPDTLTNEPGVFYKVKPGSRFERLNPGQVSPQLEGRKISDAAAIAKITGVNEAMAGEMPKNVTAAYALERMQTQAIGRLRLVSRGIDFYSAPLIAKLTASRICKYWSQERILRLYNNDGNLKVVKYNPDSVENLNYDIKTLPSSMSGIDQAAIYGMMSDFVKNQMMPAKTFFKSVNIPNKKQILADMEQDDAIKNENEALKQQLAEAQAQLEQLIGNSQTNQPVQQ